MLAVVVLHVVCLCAWVLYTHQLQQPWHVSLNPPSLTYIPTKKQQHPKTNTQVNSDRDRHGNTALHMSVVHDQPDMYDFLVDLCGADTAVTNHGGLSPLVLAAHMGKLDMLRHITSRRRRTFYSFGRVRREG